MHARDTTGSRNHGNEARLCNGVAFGTFGPMLDLLGKVKTQNTMLIGSGKGYETRKVALMAFVANWRAQQSSAGDDGRRAADALIGHTCNAGAYLPMLPAMLLTTPLTKAVTSG